MQFATKMKPCTITHDHIRGNVCIRKRMQAKKKIRRNMLIFSCFFPLFNSQKERKKKLGESVLDQFARMKQQAYLALSAIMCDDGNMFANNNKNWCSTNIFVYFNYFAQCPFQLRVSHYLGKNIWMYMFLYQSVLNKIIIHSFSNYSSESNETAIC